MGYTTDFVGEFKITPVLKKEHKNYLIKLSETRRMKRNVDELISISDPVREMADLPVGEEGEFFIGGGGFYGQDRDTSIIDYNSPPATQPGLWLKWSPSEDGSLLLWNGAEKFYNYIEWLGYLIKNFLGPWGYKLKGEVAWQGEDQMDIGKIIIKNNVISVKHGKIVYS